MITAEGVDLGYHELSCHRNGGDYTKTESRYIPIGVTCTMESRPSDEKIQEAIMYWSERSVRRAFDLCDDLLERYAIQCSLESGPSLEETNLLIAHQIAGEEISITWGVARCRGLEAFIKIVGEVDDSPACTIRETLQEDLADLMESIGYELGPIQEE